MAQEQWTADVAIIGSGVAGVTVARALLNDTPGLRVIILEAGGYVPMSHYRLWLDFVASGAARENAPYEYYRDDIDSSVNAYSEGFSGDRVDHRWNFPGSRLLIRGGSTLHWSGWCLRMKPEDFSLYSNTGKGVDWPIAYSGMNDFYSQAECLLQVAGENGDSNQPGLGCTNYPFQSIPYPVSDGPLIDLWDELGVGYGPLPIARNTIPNASSYVGLKNDPDTPKRPLGTCRATGTCKYCPVMGRFTNDQSLDYLLRQYEDNVTLLTRTVVNRLVLDSGRARHLIAEMPDEGREVKIKFDHVFVCNGAVEAPKLLIQSGLTNEHIGAHVHFHPVFTATGVADEPRLDISREVGFETLCTRAYDTEKEQAYGKALIVKARNDPAPALEKKIKEAMTRSARTLDLGGHSYTLQGMMETVDGANTRIVPLKNKDKFGLQRTEFRISGALYSKESIARHMETMVRWLKMMGYRSIHEMTIPPRADHLGGTTRMSLSPDDGVVDPDLRVHGLSNVHVIGNSVFPTGGAVNPTLTLAALALRFAKSFKEKYSP